MFYVCGICLESDISCDAKIPCSHTFCLQCILQWSLECNTCPLCKAKFNEVVAQDGTKHVVVDKVQSVTTDEDELFQLLFGDNVSEDDSANYDDGILH
jgi:Ring finger domain